ncbi:hypothetical protein [Terrisporobacter sp.]|uniref:hypothetical protein n=1 Tax=Terrisporobacter sp. TaxID=1965305 RepID=UPI002A821415|nr:hypothetical protein [Terrisporobacter sp.]MDY4136982.1 hypothetical protein [Terrisporobacter sp.]
MYLSSLESLFAPVTFDGSILPPVVLTLNLICLVSPVKLYSGSIFIIGHSVSTPDRVTVV